jgi:hypothetical protein
MAMANFSFDNPRPFWESVMELRSRKEVLRRWLENDSLPPLSRQVLREVLDAAEKDLQAAEDRLARQKTFFSSRKAG